MLGNPIDISQQTLSYFVIELVQRGELRPFTVTIGLPDQAKMSKVSTNWALSI